METVFFKGTPCQTYGTVPVAGDKAPDFRLTDKDLKEITMSDFAGKRIVLNIFPSLDTPVCASSVRNFNKIASEFADTAVICVSKDLPFAMSRFCTLEGLDGVTAASAFRSPEFCRDYGIELVDGPLAGLLARAVLIIDENHNIIYSDLVSEITDEPDYEGARYVLRHD